MLVCWSAVLQVHSFVAREGWRVKIYIYTLVDDSLPDAQEVTTQIDPMTRLRGWSTPRKIGWGRAAYYPKSLSYLKTKI